MARKPRKFAELITNAVLMIWGWVVIIFSVKLGFGSFEEPGTGLVPFLAGFSISITALLLILFGTKTGEGDRKSFISRHEFKTYSLMIIVFVCWITLMPYLGYLLVTLISTLTFSKIMGLKGWAKAFVLSTGTTLLTYLLFDRFLYLDLPRGILG
jgi:putative tricarboxylic transport membrane protein